MNMKALSSPDTTAHRTTRRVPKPLMEKRRRERINHCLESLRLLMLESTHNERLKNPKVEKAEILESVVQFLKTETQEPSCGGRKPNYLDNARPCLLRVTHFIASQSQGAEVRGRDAPQLPEMRVHPSSPGHVQETLIPAVDSAPHPRHRLQNITSHPYVSLHCESKKQLSPTTHITDPVWRPWPQ